MTTTPDTRTIQRRSTSAVNPRRQPMPLWLSALGILLAVVAIGVAWRFVQPGPAPEPPPDPVSSLTAEAPSPTPAPTELPPPPEDAVAAIPTQTATTTLPETPTTAPSAAQSAIPAVEPTQEPAPEQPETVLPLPTVTPTPEILDIAPRSAQIAGVTTLRLTISGREFESTGLPLRIAIPARAHTLDGGAPAVSDAWCMQLGLTNLFFDLSLRLNPATEELATTGRIELRADFCDDPGPALDSVEVNLNTPTGSAAQIAYNLRGERALLGDTNFLSTDVGVIVELEVTNSRPR